MSIECGQNTCKLESDFIRWALKLPTERTTDIPLGDSSCTDSKQKGDPLWHDPCSIRAQVRLKGT